METNFCCFTFTDYLQIHTITIAPNNDIVSIQGFWRNPLEEESQYSYLETSFSILYELLDRHKWMFNDEEVLDKLANVLSDPQDEMLIDLGNEPLELSSMVFRMSFLVEDPEADEWRVMGYYIEDFCILYDCSPSFHQHLTAPRQKGETKHNREHLAEVYSKLSNKLVSLTLRYEYYRHKKSQNIPEPRALYLSSLVDPMVFEAAKSAHALINFEREYPPKQIIPKRSGAN